MSDDACNRLVEFLANYGPVAASDSLVDEHARQTREDLGVSSIDTPAPRLDDVRDAIMEHRLNVVLTGTAGDGKTYHIRRFVEANFPEALPAWPGEEGVLSLALPDGSELRVIRDLSEITDSEKQAELASFVEALLGRRDDRRYLVAANDGQLLRYFRDAIALGGSETFSCRELLARFTLMLRDEVETTDNLPIRLMNLSRNWSQAAANAIFDAVLDHPDWGDCGGCQGAMAEKPCPILLNRSLLLGEGAASPFRARLLQSLRLAAANDQHVPIRQLLTLVVNILLGDAKDPDRPLMDCPTARKRASAGDYAATNPYSNAMGRNLRDDRRRANQVFGIFEVLGVGLETNNLIDAMLVQREPRALYDELFDEETVYGADLFDPLRRDYLGGGAGDVAVRRFRQGLEAQRRRAFFRLPDDAKPDSASPWRLTIFHHGGEYLRLLDALESKRGREATDPFTRQLVRGLNRALTGMMTSDEDRLWLAGTIGKTDDPTGRVSIVDPVERSSTYLSLRLTLDETTRRPSLGVAPPAFVKNVTMPRLDLRPLLFEYLMRVANGSLPASFSRQCHQEIRHYALVATAAIGALQVDEEPGPDVVRILSLGAQGEIQANRIEI